MNLTNDHGLPAPIVAAIKKHRSRYRKTGDYSTTELLTPARIAKLKKQHWQELSEDASDNIYALMGHVIHEVLASCDDDSIVEQDVSMAIDGVIISGRFDRLHDGTLQDWKVCSVWEYKIDGVRPDKIEQLNIYAELCRHSGYIVNDLEIVQIFRDWSRTRVLQQADYPPEHCMVTKVDLWPREKTLSLISERLAAHREDGLPECTPEDRWMSPEGWAVMVKGLKRAKRVLPMMSEAHEWAENYTDAKGREVYVEHRPPGEPTRCKHYCPVSAVCDQWRAYNAKNAND